MFYAFAIAQLLGSALQSYGIRQSGRYEQASYNLRAMQSDLDAEILTSEAMLERKSGSIEEARLRRRMAAVQGTQRATAAASGVKLSGSTAQVLAESADQQELDALMLRFNSENRAMSKELSAARSRGNANILRSEGAYARSAKNAASSLNLLMGGTQAATTYFNLSQFSKGGSNA